MKKYPLMRNNILRQDLDEVIKHLSLDDPILTNGPMVRRFEEEWSKWLGVKYSVFVNSGASSNLITMSILKNLYPQGGEIIVPTLTWVSDISSVIQTGFTPVFVDINPDTLGMDTKLILDSITDNTRAVFLTHAQGFNALTDELISKLNKLNIPLIEDVCESHGATHNGNKAGTFGLISNFSFFYAHHMSTIEGGMICTNNKDIFEQARMLRSHGMVREAFFDDTKDKYLMENPDLNKDFIFSFPAFNMRNNEIGGILGISQLKRLDHNIKLRKENLKTFLSLLNSEAFKTDFYIKGSSNYAFNVILRNKDKSLLNRLINLMTKEGIEFRMGSAGGGNQLRQPYLRGIIPSDYYKKFPVTEHIHFYGFYIGNFPDLSKKEVISLCDILNSAV